MQGSPASSSGPGNSQPPKHLKRVDALRGGVRCEGTGQSGEGRQCTAVTHTGEGKAAPRARRTPGRGHRARDPRGLSRPYPFSRVTHLASGTHRSWRSWETLELKVKSGRVKDAATGRFPPCQERVRESAGPRALTPLFHLGALRGLPPPLSASHKSRDIKWDTHRGAFGAGWPLQEHALEETGRASETPGPLPSIPRPRVRPAPSRPQS